MSLGRTIGQFKASLLKPFSNWWANQRDRHLVILGTLTMLGFCLVMWSVLFFFFLDGAADPDLTGVIPWTWFGLLVGFTLLIFAAPEYFHYHGQWSVLNETLKTTSRADLNIRRKESDEAAALLGSVWAARLRAHYIEHGVLRARELPSEAENKVAEDILIDWWRTEDSRLSRWIPLGALRMPILNRTIGSLSFITMLLQLYNMSFGLARNSSGNRVNTIHVWEWLNGARIDSYPAPYFDDISGWILLLISTTLFWATFPASGERPDPSEEEE